MATLADLLGVPTEFAAADGKKYALKELTLHGQAKFSRWLEQRAIEAAGRAQQHLPDDAGDRALRHVMRDIAAGVYEWGSEASLHALGQPAGIQKAIALSLAENAPPGSAEDWEAVAAMLAECRLKEVVAVLAKAKEDGDLPFVLAALGIEPMPTPEPQ